MRKITLLLLLSCVALVSFSHGAVVVSDGPADSAVQGQSSGNSKVVTTDGPREWTQAGKNGIHLYGQWVVESEGPGTAKVVGAPADPAATPFPSPLVKNASAESAPAPTPSVASSKIVISDGPRTAATPPAKHTVKVARAKKAAPVMEAETSTLAPMIPTKAQPATPLLPAEQAPRPQSASAPSGASAWKMATFLLSFALIILLSIVWTTRKRTF